MHTPKISIIVPVYNVERYLRQCIDSILAQRFTDFELLLIDDGSPDDSGQICDDYSLRDPRIRVFHKENGGVSSARNVGLERAEGEWIAFCDADDYFLPDALSTLVGYAMQYDVDIVLANALRLRGGEYTRINNFEGCRLSANPISAVKRAALWGYLFRGSLIREHGIRFTEGLAYSEDRVFNYTMASYAANLLTCEETVYVYRINDASACASTDYLKKAQNQFHAAMAMGRLIEHLAVERKADRRLLDKVRNFNIEQGIAQIVRSEDVRHAYLLIKEMYEKFMGASFSKKCSFYMKFVLTVAKHYRKRVVTIDSLRALIGLKKRGLVEVEP